MALSQMLVLIEKAILTATAMLAASTPAAPLIAQNQGVGRVSSALTSAMPVGKPNPMSSPSGANIKTAAAARITIGLASKTPTKNGSQNGSAPR